MLSFKERKADISVTYKCIGGLKLPMQVFLPDRNVHKAGAVLCIHGGGWMANNARYLAECGFIGITASYRSLSVSEKLNVSDLLSDCTDMIRYMKKHMQFIDFSDIAYIGDSAGGYFAVMLGLSQDDTVRPKCAAALNPVLGSFDDKWKYGFNGIDIGTMLPQNLIGEKCADFLFMHGTADKTADIEYTKALNDTLLKKGHRSELIELPGIEHAFALYDYKYSDEFVNGIMDKIAKYIEEHHT